MESIKTLMKIRTAPARAIFPPKTTLSSPIWKPPTFLDFVFINVYKALLSENGRETVEKLFFLFEEGVNEYVKHGAENKRCER